MGVIRKQSVKSSLLIYIGIAVGFVNSAILLPKFFSPEEVGLLGFLNSLSSVFSIVASFGIPLITIKLFPEFRSEEKKHSNFFGFLLLTSFIGIGFGLSAFWLFSDLFISSKNAARYYPLFAGMFALAFAGRVLFRNFDGYARMLFHSVTGAFLENVFMKLVILLTAIVVILWGLSYDWLFIGYSIALSSTGIGILFYVLRFDNGWNPSTFFTAVKPRKKEMMTIGLFGILGGLGTIIVLEVDRLMVSNMLGLSANGIYTVAFFFGVFVSTPARGLRRIAQVVISDSWQQNDLDNVAKIYRKSCNNQLLIAGYLFLCIWFGIDYVFTFMQPEYAAGKYVILFIGLAQVIDMGTGVNAEIILTSKYYRYNSYFIGGLIGLVLILNYVFIPIMGITGAALATLLAMFFINLMRFIFIYRKFGFNPYTVKNVYNLLIFGFIFLFLELIPGVSNPFLGLFVSGSIITILYWLPAYFLNISDDINGGVDKLLKRIKLK